jgi:hypothetical protein
MNALAISRVERAAAYLAKCPAAIEGQGGDNQTYKACCVLVNDFGLEEAEAWPLLLEWNRHCLPPWKESDLRTKLHSALRCTHPKQRGHKLDLADHRYQRPMYSPPPTLKGNSSFTRGTAEQLKRVAASRPYSLEGLVWASERGLLVFGNAFGFDCYGVTDSSKRILEIRRVDGIPFPSVGNLGERKSHALRGSDKHWPVGILEAHSLVLWEQASKYSLRDVHCAPVVMLSSSPSIAEDALDCFEGKHVRIFPHADEAGRKAGRQWANQLYGIVAKVELFDFGGLCRVNREPAKDLYDCRDLDPAEYLKDEDLWKLLP